MRVQTKTVVSLRMNLRHCRITHLGPGGYAAVRRKGKVGGMCCGRVAIM